MSTSADAIAALQQAISNAISQVSTPGVPQGISGQLPVPVGQTQAQADAINAAQKTLSDAINAANGVVTQYGGNWALMMNPTPGVSVNSPTATTAPATAALLVSSTLNTIEQQILNAINTYEAIVSAALTALNMTIKNAMGSVS